MTDLLQVHASALPRIMSCVGSVALAAQAPKPEQHDVSEEGVAAHWLAEQFFRGKALGLEAGTKAPNGHVCDADMFDHVREFHHKFNNPDLLQAVEAPTHWSPQIDPRFEVRGKADLTQWFAERRTLAITDLKYGFRYVDAEWNWQLLAYAIGVAIAARLVPDKFILAIYQPRGPGEALRYWEATPQQVLEAYHRICAQMDAVIAGADALATGPHCRYCPAAAGCPATERAAYGAIDVAMNSGTFAVREETMASELELLERAAEMLKQRKTWIEGAALAAMRDGRPVPGLSSRPQLGHTTWLPGAETKLRELQSDNQRFFDEVPVTPAEAKRRGLSEEEYKALTHRPLRGHKLVTAKDGAKAAAKAFK